MATQEIAPLQIDPSSVGTLEVGGIDVPYADLNDEPVIHTHVRLGEGEYVYQRSFPVKGHGALMPAVLDELRDAGRRVLVVERDERYILFAT